MGEEIINRIKQIRKKTGLSQDKFAKAIGVSSGNVSSWESGKALPGALALKAIHENLGYSVNWILTGKEEHSVYDKQKNEAADDPELKEMYDILKDLMQDYDRNMRGWTIVQFRKAFAEHCATKISVQINKPTGILHIFTD